MSGLRVVGLDLDGGLTHRPRLRALCEQIVDLTAESQPLRLFCGGRTAARARSKIEQARARCPGPWLAVSGTGDFHHLSLLLLESMPAPVSPFTLVLIDNHPDWFRLPPKYHCGNWVAGALRLTSVKRAVLIGQDSNDFRPRDMFMAPLRDLASGRLQIFPWSRSGASVPGRWPRSRSGADGPMTPHSWGSSLTFAPIATKGANALFQHLADELRGQDIYISLDKDCLRSTDAATDWDQGQLQLDDVIEGLAMLRRECRVIGADICGDKAAAPLRGWIKRFDAGRPGTWRAPSQDETALNEESSLKVISVLTCRGESHEGDES